MDQQAPSPAMVEKLTRLNGYRKVFDLMMREYPLLIAMPYLPKDGTLPELLGKYQRPEELSAAFNKIYGKHYTADEVLDMIAFFKTSAGRKFVEVDERMRVELRDVTMQIATEIAIDLVRHNRDNLDLPYDPNNSGGFL